MTFVVGSNHDLHQALKHAHAGDRIEFKFPSTGVVPLVMVVEKNDFTLKPDAKVDIGAVPAP